MVRTPTGGRQEQSVPKCTKRFYPDPVSARLALKHVAAKTKPGSKKPRGVHPCSVCHGWHLTSKKEPRRKRPKTGSAPT